MLTAHRADTVLDRANAPAESAEGWGTRVIDRLSDDLHAAYPDMRGLSRSKIRYMRQMAAAWPEDAIGQNSRPIAVGPRHGAARQAR
jgi:hypothetical protein